MKLCGYMDSPPPCCTGGFGPAREQRFTHLVDVYCTVFVALSVGRVTGSMKLEFLHLAFLLAVLRMSDLTSGITYDVARGYTTIITFSVFAHDRRCPLIVRRVCDERNDHGTTLATVLRRRS